MAVPRADVVKGPAVICSWRPRKDLPLDVRPAARGLSNKDAELATSATGPEPGGRTAWSAG